MGSFLLVNVGVFSLVQKTQGQCSPNRFYWGRVRNDLKLALIIQNDVKLPGESHCRLLHCSWHPPPPYMNTPDSSIRKNKTCPPAIVLSLALPPPLCKVALQRNK